MKVVAGAIVCAILAGLAIGWIDGALLARSQESEALWGLPLLALAGALAAAASAFSKSIVGAASTALLVLAFELTTSVLARGCGGSSECTGAVVQSLIFPLAYIYLFVSLPASALLWWLRHRRGLS